MAKNLLSKVQKDRLVARLLLGGLDEQSANKAVAVLNVPDETIPGSGNPLDQAGEKHEPAGISPATQARIDRHNGKVAKGQTWRVGGAEL